MYKWLLNIWESAGKDRILLHFDFLLRRSLTVLLIQLTGLVLAFGGNLLLARLYGEQVYGVYALLSNWIFFLAAIALFGMDDMHLVKLSSLKWQGGKKAILSHLRNSLKINTVSFLVVSAAFCILVNEYKFPGLSEYAYYCNLSIGLLFLLTFFNNLSCSLRALDKVVVAEVADKVIRPVVFLVLLFLFYRLWRSDLLTEALMANMISLGCILLLSAMFVIKTIRSIEEGPKTESGGGISLKVSLRYVALTLLYLLSVRMDILLLGSLSGPADVGHYNVAIKFVDILSYPIAIVNLSLPALLARRRHGNGGIAVPESLYAVAKSIFFQCLALGLLFLPLGHWILSWYGKGFGAAFPIVAVLFLSALVTASTGSIDVFFIMDGQEKKVIYCRILTVVLMPVLALFLIPVLGNIGAAFASLACNLVYCGLLQYSFYRKYGIFIHPFAPGTRASRSPSIPGKDL